MKLKIILTLFLFILFVNIVVAEDIIYVVKNVNSPDQNVLNILEELGLSVRIVDDDAVSYVNWINFKMILVDGKNNYLANPLGIPVNSYKSLIFNTRYYSLWGWSNEIGKESSPSYIRNINLTNPLNRAITQGVPEYFYAYTRNDPNVGAYYLKGKKATGINLISYVYGPGHVNSDSVLAAINPGTKLLNGETAQKRELFFGLVGSNLWTSESRRLFKNSVEWVFYGADIDNDGRRDDVDNCPLIPNSDQVDSDHDSIGNVCDICVNDANNDIDHDNICGNVDNCPNISNTGQENNDHDSMGDVCDSDDDNDNINDIIDNCPLIANTNQLDSDDDNMGDVCDSDDDNDNILDINDRCPATPIGEVVDSNGCAASQRDSDNDGVRDNVDNCVNISNPGQEDFDSDNIGDVCDDSDLDGIMDNLDNCPNNANPGQENNDNDHIGDVCDNDDDNDNINDIIDNCPLIANTNQADIDSDGKGDLCDFDIKINEFTVDPQRNWSNSGGITDSDEWFELYNPTNLNISLDSWTLDLIDSTNETEILNGIIGSGEYLVILNPIGAQNNDGRLELRDNNGNLVDSVSYGNWEDGNIVDNAPDGNANDINDECLLRLPNGIDTNVDRDDFVKGKCSYGESNNNDAPILNLIGNKHVNENSLLQFTLIAIDPENDSLTYSADSLPAGATLNSSTGLFSWTPSYEQSDVYRINFSVSDGSLSDFEVVSISVTNINRNPVYNSLAPILIEWNEDEIPSAIDLNNYFSDPDNDSLSYSVYNTSVDRNITVNINNNILTMTSPTNWNGEDWMTIKASDGKGGSIISTIITLKVNPVNDAPVLNPIANINVHEGELVKVIPSATDVDHDILSYIFGSPLNAIGEWQTNYTSVGVYNVTITVSDGNLTDSKNVTITVNEANEPPHLEPIANITIIEDSDFVENGRVNATDNDGIVVNYLISKEDVNKVDCSLTDRILGVKPTKDFSGIATCSIKAIDDDNAFDEYNITIDVTPVNDAPVIDSYYPLTDLIITENGNQEFGIEWHDIDNLAPDISVKWYVNNIVKGYGNNYNFIANGIDTYNIKVEVNDSQDTAIHEWSLRATNVPIVECFNGETSDFNNVTESGLANYYLILEKIPYGKIVFLEPIDLRDVADICSSADIVDRIVTIDSNSLNTFKNKKARVYLNNIVESNIPTIYYNTGFTINREDYSTICPICSEIDYSNNILSFNVNSFSGFMAGGNKSCAELNGNICTANERCSGNWLTASDSDRCCSAVCEEILNFTELDMCKIVDGNLSIDVEEPKKGDDFKVGEEINIEVDVKNKDSKDKDVTVEAVLYDVDDNEEIETTESDETEIEKGKKETFNDLKIKIPYDIEIDHDFVLYIKAEDDSCNEKVVDIDIKKNKHDVVIDNFEINPNIVNCNEDVDVEVEVENIGKEDEDVYIELINSELNINERSDEFELKEDNDYRVRFNFKLEKVEEKSYDLKAVVHFGNEEIEKEESITVSRCVEEGRVIERMDFGVSGVADIVVMPLTNSLQSGSSGVLSFKVVNNMDRDFSGVIELENTDDWARSNTERVNVGAKQSNIVYMNVNVNNIVGRYNGIVNVRENTAIKASNVFDVDIKEKPFVFYLPKADDCILAFSLFFANILLLAILLFFMKLLIRR